MKKYVSMIVAFSPEGEIRPLQLIWEDGQRFDIDRVLEARRASSLKAGGMGMRYKCRIHGQERYLFLEDGDKWFVEA